MTDLQMVDISLAVLYRPSADHLPRIYQNLGMTFDERVLPSIMNEVVHAWTRSRIIYSLVLDLLLSFLSFFYSRLSTVFSVFDKYVFFI
jgi:hypothetical protein